MMNKNLSGFYCRSVYILHTEDAFYILHTKDAVEGQFYLQFQINWNKKQTNKCSSAFKNLNANI